MKLGLVLACLLVAAAATTIDINRAYTSGKEYVYSYETVTTTSFTTTTNQVTALKYKFNVRLLIKEANIIHAKLETPVLCKVHQEVPTDLTVETLLEHSCERLTGPEAEHMIAELIKPFAFKWENGLISDIRVEVDEPVWSVNIKRGIVSMLQLNLHKHNEIETLPEELRTILSTHVPDILFESLPNMKTMFRAYEKDVVGECETIYALREQMEHTTPIIRVNKAINYNNCKTKPVLRAGLAASLNDITTTMESPLKMMSHADYTLVGDHATPIVQNGIRKTHYSVMPFGAQNDEMAYTYIIQKLNFVSVLPTPSSVIRMPPHMTVKPDFEMEIPLELSTTEPTAMDTTKIAEKVETIRTILETIVRDVVPEIKPSLTPELYDLVLILKQLPITDLKNVVENYCINVQTPKEFKKKEIVLDVLPTLERTDLVEVITFCMEQHVITPERAALMYKMMVLTAKPSFNTFQDLKELIVSPIISRHPIVKKTVMLSTGILANKIRNMLVEMGVEKTVLMPELHKVYEHLLFIYRSCQTEEEKMVALAMIGNAGMLEVVPLLEEIILNVETPITVKTKAVFALKKLAPVIPKKIQKVLLPIFLNKNLQVQLRISSFLIIMKTEPDMGVMQLISHGVKTDLSIEVVSFVYTYLESLKLSENPKYVEIGKKCALILEEIEKIHPGLVKSRTYVIEKVLKTMGPLGGEIRFAMMNSAESPIPESFIAKMATSLMGFNLDIAEVGIDVEGLKSILVNIMTQYESFLNGDVTVNEMLLPLTHFTSRILTATENIRNKFDTTDRPVSELVLSFYTKLFDYEIFNTVLKKNDLTALYVKVLPVLPVVLEKLRTGYDLDVLKTIATKNNKIILPTPCGLPLKIENGIFGLLRVHGNIRLEGLDRLAQLKTPFSLQELKLSTDIKTNSVLLGYGAIGVGLPFYEILSEIKIELEHFLPIKADVMVHVPEKKIEINIEPITETKRLLKLKVTPLTAMYRTFINTLTDEYIDIPIVTVPTEIVEYSALPVAVTYELAREFCVLKPLTYFLTPSTFEIKYVHSAELPTTYKIEMIYDDDEIPAGAQTSHWWNSVKAGVNTFKFEHIEPEAGIVATSRKELLVHFKTEGGDIVREAKLKVSHMNSLDLLKHQLNVQLLTSPLVHYFNNPLKVVVNKLLVLPEFIFNYEPVTTVRNVEKEMLCKTEVYYGITNTVEKFLDVLFFFKRTPLTDDATELEHIVKLFKTDKPYMIPLVRKTSVLSAYHDADAQRIIPEKNNFVHPLVVETDITVVEEKIPSWMRYILPTIKYVALNTPTLFTQTAQVSVLPAENLPEKVKIETTFNPLMAEIEIKVSLPDEVIKVTHLPLPAPILFTETELLPLYESLKTKLVHGNLPSAMCVMKSNNVIRGADLLTVPLPTTQCELVLSKDCSALNLYMVSTKMINNQKHIIVMVKNQEIEIVPETTKIVVKVNGESKTLQEREIVPVFTPEYHNQKLIEVIRVGSNVVVTSPVLGLTVIYDGETKTVAIKMPELLRNNACGLCGDFNANLRYEMRGPDMQLYTKKESFVANYAIPDFPTCDPATLRTHITETLTPTECELLFRNVERTRVHNGESQTCFSTLPVGHCPKSCTPTATTQIPTSFTCLPNTWHSTQRLQADIRHRPVDLTTRDIHITESVEEPTLCH